VRSLIREQFPQWRRLPVRPVQTPGTVNAIFRIGDELVARFPLMPESDGEQGRQQLEQEAAAAAELLHHAPFATPRPVAVGAPGVGYPAHWAVSTWVPGRPTTADDCSESDSFTTDLAAFITAVRAIDTNGRVFAGEGRGGELAAHDDWVQECLIRSEGLLDTAVLGRVWAEMRDLPRGSTPDMMNHGDLIPPNILVAGTRLVGVIDVGGLAAADPALDLVSAWHLLDADRRRLLRDLVDCDDAEWHRGRAWAFQQALGAVWYYVESSPTMSAGCRRTLERIVDDVNA
jgi:aminoglycoside phosphotransferase (APT) family kinase protein